MTHFDASAEEYPEWVGTFSLKPFYDRAYPTGAGIFAPVQIMERTTPPSTRTAAPVVAEACSEAR